MKNEVVLILNSNKQEDQKAQAYAGSLDGYAINEIDITTSPLTARQLTLLSNNMKMDINSLLDQTSKYYQENLQGQSFEADDLANIMIEHPEALRTPIIQANRQTFFVDSSYSMIRKALFIHFLKPRS